MVMVNGVYLTNQQAQFYNGLYAQGGDYRATAIRFLESRRTGQQPQPQQQPVMGPVQMLPGETTAQYNARINKTSSSPTTAIDLKNLLSGPAPAIGSYQTRPGGPILIKTEAENTRINTERQINQIKDTPYKTQHGYIPSDTGYTKEIQSSDNELTQQKQYLSQVQSASEGTTFIINEKQYTQQEAINLINKSINQLSSSKAILERYQEAGYVFNKTDAGYSFSLPKASDVYVSIHGKELSGVALTSASFMKSPLAIGTLASGIQYAITRDEKVRQSEFESLSEYALGLDESINKGEYIQKVLTSPAMLEGVYLPVALMTGTALIGVAGKGATMLGGRVAETGIGSKIISGAEIISTKIAPVSRPLVSIGTKISTYVSPVAKSVIGKQAVKYGMFGAMAFIPENPITGKGLYKTITESPEQAGSALGQSLFGWELGWGAMEAGSKLPQQIQEMNIGERLGLRPMGTETSQPILGAVRPSEISGRVQSFGERLGVRPLGEEATQPLPGAKRLISTKGMTEEERFAFEYKPSKQVITAEERELEGLARSLDKKKPSRFQEFIKSEEGTQPLLPSIGPKGRSSFGNKRTFKDLLKGEETAQPLPGIRPQERTIIPRKEIFFSETTGKTEFIGGRLPRGMATTIEEFPRTGGLEIGEAVRPTSPLNLPASYEKEVTRVGSGKRRLDIIEAKQGPTGELSMTESKLGKLEMIEFTPEKTQYFEGLMRPARGQTTVSGRSPYGPGGPARSLETIPETKEQAVKSWEKIFGSKREISKIPATKEEAIARIQSYYGEPVKTEGTVALRIGDKTKLYTKEDIADFTGLAKPEPTIKQGNYALDFKGEEKIFRTEIPGGEKPYSFDVDIGKIGSAKTERYAVNVKGQTKVYTKEDILGFVKEENKLSLLRAIEEQPEKTAYAIIPEKHTSPNFTKVYTTEDFAKGLRYEPGPRPDNFLLRKTPELKDELGNLIETAKEPQKPFSYRLKELKDKTNTLTREDTTGLNKAGLQARPQKYSKAQLEKAIYSPGGSAEYYGKQLRKTLRVKIDKPIPVGTRPQEGWSKFLGERQNAKILIEKPKQYSIPELEKPMQTIRSKKTTPSGFTKKYTTEDFVKTVRYEPGPRPGNFLLQKEQKPFSIEGEPIGKQPYVIETKPLMERTSFKPTGLYESPEMKNVTVQRPLSREEVNILMGPGSETAKSSSRYWETIRPKIKESAQLLSRIQRKGLTAGAGGIIASIGINRGRLQFSSSVEGQEVGSLNIPLQDIGSARLSELQQDQLLGQQQYQLLGQQQNQLLGQQQAQETQQEQEQKMESLTALKQDQLLEQQQAQEGMRLTGQTPIRDTVQKQDLFTRTITDTNLIKPRIILFPGQEEEPEHERKKTKPMKNEAYDVYVKERGMYHGKVRKGFKFSKANRKPLTESDALSLGGDITDNTSAVSFRLKKTIGRPERPDRSIKLFSERQHKFTKKGETYIEKPDYRMDSPGELQQVSALGQQERRNQGRRNTLILHPVKKTYSHGTGLLSPTNKIMETKMFRKKKGGKKNDYY